MISICWQYELPFWRFKAPSRVAADPDSDIRFVSQRLDPDPVHLRPDPQPWRQMDMSLNRGTTHFTLGLRPYIISSLLLLIYLRPPLLSKLPSSAPACLRFLSGYFQVLQKIRLWLSVTEQIYLFYPYMDFYKILLDLSPILNCHS